ncbi:MAG: XRE family transcriptional regulator [Alcaligenaceae bacterium]|nr:MAG: XRE family transcriptional regulator [Alcaligenaceae bacterium]
MPQILSRDEKPIFGVRLRYAREAAAISQFQLGVSIGIDEGSSSARISRYESGTHEPAVKIARALAAKLKVPLAYLYCDDDLLAQIILAMRDLSRDRKRELLDGLRLASSR